jgi:hypothetical protein
VQRVSSDLIRTDHHLREKRPVLREGESRAHVGVVSLTGGVKSLFRLPLKGEPLPRLVVAEAAIDALSLAAIENLRGDTLYAATGGGMGPGTIAALETLLVDIARLADRHQSLAMKFGIPFARLRPPIEGGDWNEALRGQS